MIALTVDPFLWPTLAESVLPCTLMFCGNLLTGVKLPKLNRDRERKRDRGRRKRQSRARPPEIEIAKFHVTNILVN